MNKLLTSNNGGFPVVLDDIRWNDEAYRAAMTGILLAFGTDFIVQGCVYSSGSITSGYIMLNSELLQVDAHTSSGNGYYQKIITYNSSGSKTFKNSSVVDTYQQNRGLATASSGTLKYNGSRLTDILVLYSQVGYMAGYLSQIGNVDLSASQPLVTNSSKLLASMSGSDFTSNYITQGSESAIGKIQLATSAETLTGSLTTKAVHPAGLLAKLNSVMANVMPFQLLLAGQVASDGTKNSTLYRNTSIVTSDYTSSRQNDGYYKITHSLNSTSYYVLAYSIRPTGNTSPFYFGGIDRQLNYFNLFTANDSSKDDAAFEFFMFKINAYTA